MFKHVMDWKRVECPKSIPAIYSFNNLRDIQRKLGDYYDVWVYFDKETVFPVVYAPFEGVRCWDLFLNTAPVFCSKKHFIENIMPELPMFCSNNLWFVDDDSSDYDDHFFKSKECVFNIGDYPTYDDFVHDRLGKVNRKELYYRSTLKIQPLDWVDEKTLVKYVGAMSMRSNIDVYTRLHSMYQFYIVTDSSLKKSVNYSIVVVYKYGDRADILGIHSQGSIYASDAARIFVDYAIKNKLCKELNLGTTVFGEKHRFVYKTMFTPRSHYPIYGAVSKISNREKFGTAPFLSVDKDNNQTWVLQQPEGMISSIGE